MSTENQTGIIYNPDNFIFGKTILPTDFIEKQNNKKQDTNKGISRRSFVKALTVSAGALIAGCNLVDSRAAKLPQVPQVTDTPLPTNTLAPSETIVPSQTFTATNENLNQTATQQQIEAETATEAFKELDPMSQTIQKLLDAGMTYNKTEDVYILDGKKYKFTTHTGTGCPIVMTMTLTEETQECATETQTSTEQPSDTPTKENTQVNHQPSETPQQQPSQTPNNQPSNTPQSTNTPHHEQPSQTPQPSNTEVQPSQTPRPTSTEVPPTEVLPNPPTTAPTLTPAANPVQPTLIPPTEAPSMAPATQLPPQINSATPSI